MIRRTMEAGFLNSLANDPEIRPFVGGEGDLDLTPVAANPANYVITGDGGAWVLQVMWAGAYDLHTLFRKEARGLNYFRQAREALRMIFTETDCVEILTKCPDDNPGARMAALKMGFRERFRREDAWAPGVGISYQALTLEDWYSRDPECLNAGRLFHQLLEAAKPAQSILPDHPDDDAHDYAAGVAYLMIKSGQSEKGVAFYNKWALVAGYPPIGEVAFNTFDIGSGVVVEVRGGKMDVLLSR